MRRTSWIASFVAGVGVLACVSANAAAAVLTFEKVADTNTTAPGTSGKFFEFNAPVHDGIGPVFRGRGPTTIAEGLYRYEAGQLVPLVVQGTAVPGGAPGEVLETFNQTYGASGGVVAFTATTSTGGRGVYTVSGGTVTRIADTTTPRPEGGSFLNFGNPSVSGGKVAFVGRDNTLQPLSVYTNLTGPLTRVAGPTTQAPDGTGQYTFLNFPAIDGQRIVFEGGTPGGGGLYQYDNGTLSTRVNGGARPSLSQNVLAYWQNDASSRESIVLNDAAGNTVTIADQTTLVPGGTGRFGGFSPVGIASEGGRVVFYGSELGGRQGLYLYDHGTLSKIIDSTDTLDGKSIAAFSFVRDSLRGDELTFMVSYAGANAGQGIYLVTVPEPGAIGALAAGACLVLARRRR